MSIEQVLIIVILVLLILFIVGKVR